MTERKKTGPESGEKGYALITGGELQNKGAQAMSLVAVSELKRRFPELTPVLVSEVDAAPAAVKRLMGRKPRPDFDNLDFKIVNSYWCRRDAEDMQQFSRGAKEQIKAILFSDDRRATYEAYAQAVLCVDVSGFAFSDKWGRGICRRYLNDLSTLRELGVPTYLLPQSFGPFGFGGDADAAEEVRERAADVLPGVRMIFVREQDGYTVLRELCPEAHVTRSSDLVLQNRGLDLGDVFKRVPEPCAHLPRTDVKNVGIVPNERNYDHGDAGQIDALYRAVIAELLGMGYEVPLIRHASEDLAICERLKAMFSDDPRVEVYGEDRYCFEYGELFARCDFLVASRFHSIVHAYKEGVPCIATGWAVKYQELLGAAGQSDLAFDVTAPTIDAKAVLNSLHRVAEEREELSGRIRLMVAAAQRENVFDQVERDFRGLRSQQEQ